MRTPIKRTVMALLLAVVPARLAIAQTSVPVQQMRVTDAQVFWFLQNLPPESAKPLGSLINALLSDTAGHMRMAERRPATAADSLRAAGVVRTMRSALAPYADVTAAVRDGYQLFMPWLDEQVIYHYNNMQNAGAARAGFDATRPTSLLYRRDASGAKVLVGAMYTAPAASTPDELDARLPLGVAYWHQHVNFCAMRPSLAADGIRQNDSTTFARWLAIETPDACTAAGGLFVPQLFGWMVHVNAFDGDAPGAIWGTEGKDHMHMHHGH
jgi:hypothetical protein